MNRNNGYIEVTIGGKKRPMKFGTNTDVLYCEKRNCTLEEKRQQFTDIFPVLKKNIKGEIVCKGGEPVILKPAKSRGFELRDLIYCALTDGARYKRNVIDSDYKDEDGTDGDYFSELTVGDWFDEMDVKEYEIFMEDLSKANQDMDIVGKQKGQEKAST